MKNRYQSEGYSRILESGQLDREAWKVFQIMSEFVEGFERLAPIKPSVSIFGSSRTPPQDPNYQKAEQVARLDAVTETDTIYPYWHQRGFAQRNPLPVALYK